GSMCDTGPVRNGPGIACVRRLSDGGAGAGARVATLQRPALVLAHTTPYACVLSRRQRPGQAIGGNGAARADQPGIGNLRERRTTVTHREEQFGVLVATDGLVAPVHSSAPSLGARIGALVVCGSLTCAT